MAVIAIGVNISARHGGHRRNRAPLEEVRIDMEGYINSLWIAAENTIYITPLTCNKTLIQHGRIFPKVARRGMIGHHFSTLQT